MDKIPPEKAAKAVLDACADCDVCRFLMDTSCLFFPELYRLYDREFEGGEKATPREVRALVDLCNFCGQCPCPNIRAGIIEAKTQFIERDGLQFGVRTIEDVERIATLCGAFPRLTNALFQAKPTRGLLKAAMGIHQSRKMPVFPKETFPDWAKKNKLNVKRIRVAENAYDLGEYLAYLLKEGELSTNFGPVGGRIVYYPPCHLREQEIGRPYEELLNKVPGLDVEVLGGAFYCCGLAGVMGFKRQFHDKSIHLGESLMEKIREIHPDKIVTDCLSCRLQFTQLLPYDVLHPVELLREAYGAYEERKDAANAMLL